MLFFLYGTQLSARQANTLSEEGDSTDFAPLGVRERRDRDTKKNENRDRWSGKGEGASEGGPSERD